MSKSTHPFMQLLVMVAMSLGMILIAGVITAPFILAGIDISSGPGMMIVETVSQLLMFALPVVLMTIIYYRGRQREYYRLDFSGRRWLTGLVGVVLLLLLMPLIEWLTVWNDTWDLGRVGELLRSMQDQTEAIVKEMMSATTVGGLLANLFVVALMPAICEELFFRAGIQNLLQRWWRNPHIAIWVTALIFSLVHGEIFSFMPRFLLGALLGYLYVYGRSLVPNMLVHFTNNAIAVICYWLVSRGVLDIDLDAPLDFGWLLTVCCTVAAVGVMWVTLFKKSDSKALEK
ncbi:MAG: CPBP family intramembrane metalloprotease [Bacteroidales bacterium]|nr:CPBP family intramembrane metalloprotease [Bacteroidales bacterium]